MSMLQSQDLFVELSHFVAKNIETQGGKETGARS